MSALIESGNIVVDVCKGITRGISCPVGLTSGSVNITTDMAQYSYI